MNPDDIENQKSGEQKRLDSHWEEMLYERESELADETRREDFE